MEYQEAHDLMAELHYKGKQLDQKRYENIHALMSMIPTDWNKAPELFDLLSTLLPYDKIPDSAKVLLAQLPPAVMRNYRNT